MQAGIKTDKLTHKQKDGQRDKKRDKQAYALAITKQTSREAKQTRGHPTKADPKPRKEADI